jgi:hypothetical protein
VLARLIEWPVIYGAEERDWILLAVVNTGAAMAHDCL